MNITVKYKGKSQGKEKENDRRESYNMLCYYTNEETEESYKCLRTDLDRCVQAK